MGSLFRVLGHALILSLLTLSHLLVGTHANTGHDNRHAARQAQIQSGEARWRQLHSDYLDSLRSTLEPNGQCTWENMVVRREWGDMSEEARREYIAALWCLKGKPGMTDRNEFPGARSRWDDFAVGHLINTLRVHRSPLLPPWHRHHAWLLEKALREECGYSGGLPYWHWSKYLNQDVSTWPLFDNSDTSLSGNGTPRGPKCACVESGPLAAWTANLGPQGRGDGVVWGCQENPRSDGRGFNPSCIERNFDPAALANAHYDAVVYTIDQARDANAFATLLELQSPSLHNQPHLFVGGTQTDIAFSSQDPWFFAHHSMVDFVFSVWQSADWNTRTTTLADPEIFAQVRRNWRSPAERATLDSAIFISPVWSNVSVADVMWTTRNQYCYRYE